MRRFTRPRASQCAALSGGVPCQLDCPPAARHDDAQDGRGVCARPWRAPPPSHDEFAARVRAGLVNVQWAGGLLAAVSGDILRGRAGNARGAARAARGGLSVCARRGWGAGRACRALLGMAECRDRLWRKAGWVAAHARGRGAWPGGARGRGGRARCAAGGSRDCRRGRVVGCSGRKSGGRRAMASRRAGWADSGWICGGNLADGRCLAIPI